MKNIFTILLALAPFLCFSQEDKLASDLSIEDGKKSELSLFLGMSSYEGDLHGFHDENLGVTTFAKFAFGLSYKREFSQSLAASISYYNVKIEGDDNKFTEESGHPGRGFKFTNSIHEISLRADYTPFGKKDWKVQPFVFAGLGLALGEADTDFNNQVDNPVSDALIRADMENDNATSFVMPIGFGAKAMLSDKISIGLEMGLRLFSTDYLDGVSKSASTEFRDFYGIGGVTIGYTL